MAQAGQASYLVLNVDCWCCLLYRRSLPRQVVDSLDLLTKSSCTVFIHQACTVEYSRCPMRLTVASLLLWYTMLQLASSRFGPAGCCVSSASPEAHHDAHRCAHTDMPNRICR